MSSLNLFDTPSEKAKDQEFREQRDKERNPSKSTSLFARGQVNVYHQPDEEYPAEHYYQLYPGLVIEVVIANPYSLVARGHVEPVLTRVHSVNNFGVPGRMTFGIGGFVNFDELPKPIRCFPQRRNWGVVGDPIILQLSTGTHYVNLMDVDNLSIQADDHPKVRVIEHEPNLPAKVTKVFVGQLATKQQWLDSLAQARLLHQMAGQYPRAWEHPSGEQAPAAAEAPQGFAFAQAQRIRIMKLKGRLQSEPVAKARKHEVIRPEHLAIGRVLKARDMDKVRANFYLKNLPADHDGYFVVGGNASPHAVTPTTESRFTWPILAGRGLETSFSLNVIRQLFELASDYTGPELRVYSIRYREPDGRERSKYIALSAELPEESLKPFILEGLGLEKDDLLRVIRLQQKPIPLTTTITIASKQTGKPAA